MEKNSTHEGENLRKILSEKFDDLQAAADALGYNYTHLSNLQNSAKLSPKVKKKISKLLGVPLSAIETGEAPLTTVQEPEPPYFKSDKEEADYWRKKAFEAQEEIIALLKEAIAKEKGGE